MENTETTSEAEAKQLLTGDTPVTEQPMVDNRIHTINPSGTFMGFTASFPEYEVLTPQTLQSYTVRNLTVADEEQIKSSLITPRKLPDHINNILWKCIVKKPKNINSFNDFLTHTTIHDRNALLYGLYHITYKDIQNYEMSCSKCDTQYKVSVNISDIFQMDAYHGDPDEILTKTKEVDLEVIPNVSITLKQPTLKDESEMMGNMLFQSDKNLEIGNSMLIIDQVILKNPGMTPQFVTGHENIFNAWTTLPAIDRKIIEKAYNEEFGKYKVNLNIKSSCHNCTYVNETPMDLLTQFFLAQLR